MGQRRPPTRAPHVVHIGMHKSATTALQNAAFAHRPSLAAHGILYPGGRPNHNAVTRDFWKPMKSSSARARAREEWHEIEESARSPEDSRVFLSAENLSGAADDGIKRLAEALGEDTQVVITVRNFAAMLPSIWQQYIKERRTISFGDWLDGVLGDPGPTNATPDFWVRHDLGGLVRRWGAEFGTAAVTVAVLDSSRPALVYRAFESVLSLPEGTLGQEPTSPSHENRRMSTEEVELVRSVNRRVMACGTNEATYLNSMRAGLSGGLQQGRTPAPQEGVLRVPDAWLDKATDVAARGMAEARSLGATVLGDPEEYSRALSERGPLATTVSSVSLPLVAVGIAGLASRAAGAGVAFSGAREGEPPRVTTLAPTVVRPWRDDDESLCDTGTLLVAGSADVASRAMRAGVAPGAAHLHARATLQRALVGAVRDTVPDEWEALSPVAGKPGQGIAIVGINWGMDWSAQDAVACLDALPVPVEATVELPTLEDVISLAWERALAGGVNLPFSRWWDLASTADSWGDWGALADPMALAEVVGVLAAHPHVGAVNVGLGVGTTRRLTVDESELVRSVARQHVFRGVDMLAVGQVVMLGAIPGLKRARPYSGSALRVDQSALEPYLAAREAALVVMVEAGARLGGGAQGWARQSDSHVGHTEENSPGGRVDLDQATAACAGAFSISVGRGADFEWEGSGRWVGRTADWDPADATEWRLPASVATVIGDQERH